MKVFPQYKGAMVNWPNVAAIDGVPETLASLQGKYRLVVATNAAQSDAKQVRSALDRVGLGQYIQEIFTYHEIGARKPEAGFFTALQNLLKAEPEELLMIGEDYHTDILGAKQAGWYALWYNPSALPCTGLLPLHNGEFYQFQGLLQAFKSLDLPDASTIFHWLASEKASANLLIHVQMVAALAYQMALWANNAGIAVHALLAHRAGLLHDLAKTTSRLSGIQDSDHGEIAARLLEERNQPELAEIARRHLLFCLLEPARKPITWEQKLVYFADKLVEGNRPVNLELRIEALRRRYVQDAPKINACIPALYALQDEICTRLRLTPDELLTFLSASIYGD